MINRILGTTFSRFFIAICGLVIVILNTRNLGAQKLGVVALIMVSINLITQFSELIGGAAIVYLIKKHHEKAILTLGYLWSMITALVGLGIVSQFYESWVPLLPLILIIALIQNITHCHLHILMGKNRLKFYNLSTIFQIVSVVLVLFYQYFVQNQLDINSYLYAYLAGQLTLLIFTLPLAIKIGFTSVKFNDLKRAFLALTQAGFLIQLGNVFQFGVYRINYLILEVFVSTSSLGVFSLGNQLSEKTLIPVNATSMVQYIEVSNTEDLNKALQITINVLVLAQIVSTLSVTLLVVIPQNVISFLFGEEFGESSILFPILGLGIFFLANSTIISHYFSGLGKFKINTIISFFGAIATIGVGFSIIPQYGIIGAAWTSSIVFGAQAIINFFVFKQVSKITWGKFINIYGASLKSAPNRLIQKLKN